jgi:hypothetical protein
MLHGHALRSAAMEKQRLGMEIYVSEDGVFHYKKKCIALFECMHAHVIRD